MKHLFAFFFLFISIETFAQPVITKQKAYGRAATGEFSVTQTNDGGLLVGGLFVAANKYHQPWVYTLNKINKAGEVEWLNIFDSTKQNSYFTTTVLQLHDGNYAYCVVTANDSITLFKLTPGGDVIWRKTILITNNQGRTITLGGVNCLKQTADDGFIMAADNFTLSTSIVKLDAEANVTWYDIFQDTSYYRRAPYIVSVAQTTDGSFIAAGTGGESDYYIVPIDKDGVVGTSKTYHADGGDNCYSITNTNDGGYILSGVSNSKKSGVKSQNTRGDIDYWLIKLDRDLNVQWDRTLGGSGQDEPTDVKQTSDGGYIVTGLSPSNISVDKSENSKSDYYWQNDFWTIKLDKKGKIVWDKTIGGSADDRAIFIGERKPGVYTLVGSSFTALSGDKTTDAKGPEDLWVLEFTDTTSTALTSAHPIVENSMVKNNVVVIYPNPAKDIIHIQTQNKTVFTLSDQSGKVLLTKTVTTKDEINVANFPAGIYYLKNNNTGATQKIAVIK